MRIAIVGAGMAGLACAEALVASGHGVTLFDKGRAAGGRMATRRATAAGMETAFDHGAQYFTVRHPAFRARVELWHAAGLAAPWPAAGAEAWVGTPGMNAPVKQMAGHVPVHWTAQVDALERNGDGWRIEGQAFDAALVATPAEQAAPLLAPHDVTMAGHAMAAVSTPCWTVMAAFAERLPIGPDMLREDGIVGWAARNSAKPGRRGPEAWVIQAAPTWSRTHLEQAAETVIAPLLDALAERAGVALPQPLTADAHRWRYARSGSDGAGLLWNPRSRIGACGDWLLGPRVEAAWLSGTRLAERIG